METGYNGWTNWETWNIALWLDNDYDLYKYWQSKARFASLQSDDDPADVQKANAIEELALILQAQVQPTPDFDDSDFGKMATVDWDEIAESMLADHFE